jgi:hypothetical protein
MTASYRTCPGVIICPECKQLVKATLYIDQWGMKVGGETKWHFCLPADPPPSIASAEPKKPSRLVGWFKNLFRRSRDRSQTKEKGK